MRSKIGTKARLTAHILALVLLLLMLVYIAPASSNHEEIKPRQPSVPLRKSAAAAPEKGGDAVPVALPVRQPEMTEPAKTESAKPPETPKPPEPSKTPELSDSVEAIGPATPVEPVESVESATPVPAEKIKPESIAEPIVEPEPATETGAVADAETGAEKTPENGEAEKPDADGDDQAASGKVPAINQPDESGSLVVAASEAGLDARVAAATPLPDANLEVLGDGVFWLTGGRNPESELALVPDIGTLVLLTPLPGYRVDGFDHVRTESIPADNVDLDHDSAEHFLHVAADSARPVVIVPLPGARGAAFFKGVYLLANRNLAVDEVLREIGSELDQAGEAREEIVHRLLRENGREG